MSQRQTVSPAVVIAAVLAVFGLGLAAITMITLADKGSGEVTAFLSGWGTMVLVGLFALVKVDVLNKKTEAQDEHIEVIKEQTNGNLKKLMDRVNELEDGRVANLKKIQELQTIVDRRKLDREP